MNGVDLAYLERGPAGGPLALCLHGFPDHAPTFDALLGALGDAGFHAVAPWLRGYAPSGLAPDANYQTASLALDALALADALAGEHGAVLVGHDWGAMAGYTAVVHAPARFSKLVTMAVPHGAALADRIFEPEHLTRSWYQYFFQTAFAVPVVARDDFAVIDFLWQSWSPNYRAPEPFMRRLKETLSAPGTLGAAIDYYRFTFGALPSDPALGEIQAKFLDPIPVPTLYFHGAADGVMDVSLVDEALLSPWFPAGLEIEIVSGAGHFLHLEEPDAVNARIVEFLTST